MAKKFISYFKTEDDLLSAHASLQTLRTHNVTIDQIPEDDGGGAFTPAVALNQTTSNFGYAAVLNTAGNNDGDQGGMHVIEGQVEDADFEAALNILKKNNGFERSEDIR
ncbi:hypothetical protein SAMN05216389_11345 [Oceanobacillus limi]|uniref:Heat induced stress protein YflT n=1 Tax=Oceanobacillus limi TaxID=930131 RepID=A0A1I0F007_9BACI|nr:hypothetical protein [Oceanobacillus limi]SET51114.1 hypothetical protein SAMN05216389_11345 [Oceanobacillus limi]